MKKLSLLLLLIISISCSKDEDPLKKGNLITLFQLPINGNMIDGDINQQDKTISFDLIGANLTSLTPNIEFSDKSTIFPSNINPKNFNQDVLYTVTAENGDQRVYKVITNNRPFNTGNDILSFKIGINGETINARIDQNIKQIAFETGSFNITNLTPEIEISENATISPASNEITDFSKPVTYTVTAEDGSSTQYIVAVNKAYNLDAYTPAGPKWGSQLLFIRAEMGIRLKFLNPEASNTKLYLNDGVNSIELPINNVESWEDNRIINYNLRTKIPENTPTSSNYKIIYKSDEITFESDFLIDVIAENAPKIISTNQNSYSYGDNLIITGENLTNYTGVPSNGSFYLLNPNGNIDVELNSTKTEYKLLLEGGFIRNAFFNNNITKRTIIFMKANSNFRMGEQVTINVNN